MRRSFTIVTTCRGRLSHLRQSLPAMLAQGAERVIVVDYDCPEGTGDWVTANHPEVHVVRAKDEAGFSPSRARNIGIASAGTEWICLLDADSVPGPGWLSWLDAHLAENNFSSISDWARQRDSSGVLVARRGHLLAAGGYDEAIRGWGGEDSDLWMRLGRIGLQWLPFPNTLIAAIPHDDAIRIRWPGFSIEDMWERTKIYMKAKTEVSAGYGAFDLCCRKALMARIMEHMSAIREAGDRPLYPFRFLRYCPDCAARFGENSELEIAYRRRPPFFASKRVLLRGGARERSRP